MMNAPISQLRSTPLDLFIKIKPDGSEIDLREVYDYLQRAPSESDLLVSKSNDNSKDVLINLPLKKQSYVTPGFSAPSENLEEVEDYASEEAYKAFSEKLRSLGLKNIIEKVNLPREIPKIPINQLDDSLFFCALIPSFLLFLRPIYNVHGAKKISEAKAEIINILKEYFFRRKRSLIDQIMRKFSKNYLEVKFSGIKTEVLDEEELHKTENITPGALAFKDYLFTHSVIFDHNITNLLLLWLSSHVLVSGSMDSIDQKAPTARLSEFFDTLLDVGFDICFKHIDGLIED